MFLHLTIVKGQVRIAIEHEERFIEQRQRFPDRTRCAEQLWSVERECYLSIERTTVSNKGLDCVTEMSRSNDDPHYAVRAQQTLHLSYCRTRKRAGEKVDCVPSRFVAELAQEDVRYADQPLSADEALKAKQSGNVRLQALKAMLR